MCVAALCAALALAAMIFRPALPIDETRYLTAAWEMFLNHNYFLPTLNFEPYHHKPPLLFWLFNLSWTIFGVHRWSAVLVVSLVSAGTIALTYKLCRQLFPERETLAQRVPWIMVASAPFLTVGTVIMFDFLLSYCVLLAWIFTVKFLKEGKFIYTLPAGLALGFGVLAKGPVVLLFTLLPWFLARFWHEPKPPKKFYAGLIFMILVGLVPVAVWLTQVYYGTDAAFFRWLVVEQTRGRMTGSFGGAHSRAFYFYIPFFIGLFTPWIIFPAFWQKMKLAQRSDMAMRFCFFTIIPALAIFMLMSGKQAHYLVPFLPFASILIAHTLESVSMPTIKKISTAMVALLVIGQGVASVTTFPRYDLSGVVNIIQANPDRPVAYVRNYHGEIGFLARRTKPVEGLPEITDLQGWFASHPDGLAVVRYRDEAEIRPYNVLYTMDFSAEKKLSVIERDAEYP